ncbi:AAA family ATPase [bacterium]|nr:AAA family ATPase [bacterium]
MLEIKNITVKNFMSVGNVTQAVNFNHDGLTLVLGNNLDLGGDGSRNGTGKTTIVNALSYALYGNALYNIKKDNLVNKTNNKQMMVTVEFVKDGINYTIERGRRPNIFRFMVGGVDNLEGVSDEMQGEGRLTQIAIEKVLGMSHTMFKHIMALNTYTDPFLSMRANEQRDLIEQLLGITQLSEKADILKDLTKQSKDSIQEETYRIRGIEEANEHINKSISDMERRQRVWNKSNADQINRLETDLLALQQIDIDTEITNHAAFDEYNQTKIQIDTLTSEVAKLTSSVDREQRRLVKAQKDLQATMDHTCYACGQELHDDAHEKILASKQEAVDESQLLINEYDESIAEYNEALTSIGNLGVAPVLQYNTLQEAYEHQNKLSNTDTEIERKKTEIDPYAEQIESLKDTGLQIVNWDEVNRLTELKDHQDFLMKLLTNKDSFIRKRIIEQNLQFLNNRLEYYITKLGLPHEVQFQSDLTVSIIQLGQDLDFDNLSRGERNRLILGLSWAFRDVFESMNHPINLICIDELVDSGMDTVGVESALGVLKKMERDREKNILLISHRDELVGRVNSVLQVTKENGFTTFNTEIEVIDA